MVLAADCLYPDMSAWPSFFATMASFVYSSNRPFGLVALHKRNGQMTLDPFLTYWRLKAEHIPLVDLGLEKEDNIGTTGLPGSSTGSIILYKITASEYNV